MFMTVVIKILAKKEDGNMKKSASYTLVALITFGLALFFGEMQQQSKNQRVNQNL